MKIYELFYKKEFDIKVGLDRIKKALKELGNPEKEFKSILISGTNGKGSTSAYIESLLRHYGLNVGLYTSPHLVRENERFQINRIEISDKELDKYIENIKPLIDKYQLSYFETTTLIAFLYFRDKKVDIAVLEVGLGGRWDATNVVYPEISVITNVSLDHTHILGDTLEKIAFEKLGIARKDRPLIVGRNQKEIIEQAKSLGIKDIIYPPRDYSYTYRHENNLTTIDYEFFRENIAISDIKSKLLGKRQGENIATALTSFITLVKNLNLKIDIELIKEAISSTRWKGRMEILSEKPLTIIDGSHNEEAISKTLEEIRELFPNRELYIIYSSMKDKNWKKYINLLLNNSNELVFVEMDIDRGLKAEEVKKYFSQLTTFNNFNQAYLYLTNKTEDKNPLILILGSLYFIGDILKNFNVDNSKKPVDN
jgi:dihydrofolate synthase/folylpolyglutamate synthase